MQILQPPDNASYGLVTIASTLRTGPDWPVFLLPLLQCIYKASLCWQLHSLLILSVADGFWECICAKALGQFIDLAVLFHVFVSSPLPDISSQVSLVLNGFWPCLPLSLLNQPAHGFSQALSCCPCPRDPHFHPTCGLHPGLPLRPAGSDSLACWPSLDWSVWDPLVPGLTLPGLQLGAMLPTHVQHSPARKSDHQNTSHNNKNPPTLCSLTWV